MHAPHRLQEFRLLDQVALAFERGIENPLGRIPGSLPTFSGAVVELSVLRQGNPKFVAAYAKFDNPAFVGVVRSAIATKNTPKFGSDDGGSWGAMSFAKTPPADLRERLYRFELAARKAMQFKKNVTQAKANICGALQELVDNIFEHSGSANTGLITFLGKDDTFELSVGDAGIGVLTSLRSNDAYSFLADDTAALSFALADGNSRFGRSAGRGNGFTTLFRALRTLDADLRFRSGDCALEVAGRGATLQGSHVFQKAHLRGFVASLRLRL